MRIPKIIMLAILLSSFNTFNLKAQNQELTDTSKKEYLNGLTKATESDMLNKQIMLDGESIPVYNIEGKRIRGQEMMNVFMSGNYKPDFYLDKNKEIKVIALRALSKEEKKILKERAAKVDDEIEPLEKDAYLFSVTDIHGKEYSLEKLKGKIIVMNFWFIQCKPCIMEMPELNRLVEKYKTQDVVFLGFAMNDKSKIDLFLKKKNFAYKLIPKSQKVINDYKVKAYPTHIIIDKNSKIVYSATGFGSNTISSIEKTIEKLIEK